MRNVLGPVVAAGVLVLSATAPSRAQAIPAEAVPPAEVSPVAPMLPTSIYAAEMLPESLTHPWVMVPRFSTQATAAAGIGYGYRFSPYGIDSRYPYYATGLYPAVYRPYARFDKPCKHGHGQGHGHGRRNCPSCP